MASQVLEISEYGLSTKIEEEHVLDINFIAKKTMPMHKIFTDVKLENKIQFMRYDAKDTELREKAVEARKV